MDFDEIFKLFSIEGVLGLNSARRVILCPLPQHAHNSNTPSFSIHWFNGRQRFNCFGNCGLHGDVVDLVGYLSFPDYDGKGEMRLKAAERLKGEFTYSPPNPEPARPTLEPWAWKNFIPMGDWGRAFCHFRGLNDETIERFKLGQMDDFITIPTFEEGKIIGIKLRRTEDLSPRYLNMKGSKRGLFNRDEVYLTQEPVVICKGEITAMVVAQYGFKACAPSAGETSDVGSMILALSQSRKKILVSDNDRDPDTRDRIMNFALKRCEMFDAELHYPPEDFKDLDEWLLADPGAINILRSWISE